MLINEEYSAKIKEVSDNFSSAEKKIKNAELLNKNLSIPSINELRYAGYHLLIASQSNDKEKITEELDKANRHTKRAYYDGVESVLLLKLDEIQTFDEEFSKIPELIEVIPNYTSKFSKVTTIVEQLQDIEASTRDEKYAIIENYYNDIKDISTELNQSRTLIINKIDINGRKEKKEQRKFILMVIIGLITIFLTILGIVFSTN